MENLRSIVRPSIALLLIGLVVYMVITGTDLVDFIKTTVALIVGFYFGERSQK